MDSRVPRPRKELSADGLLSLIRWGFDRIADPRRGSPTIPLGDALMAAFAMFSLKEPSLLAFDRDRRNDPNIEALYHIGRVPCDTSMREILDPVDPGIKGTQLFVSGGVHQTSGSNARSSRHAPTISAPPPRANKELRPLYSPAFSRKPNRKSRSSPVWMSRGSR